jgi:hypothetical protein
MRQVAVAVILLACTAGVALAQDDEEIQEPLHYGLREAAREGRSIQLGRGARGVIPEVHTVRRGDTLWDLCGFFYGNPWYWPRVWSYNDRITNPNWIYPGDPLRMRRPGDSVASQPGPRPTGPLVPESVFLRDDGFVEREQYRRSGVIVGSPDERTLLSTFDEIYVEFDRPDQVQVGREYAVFRQVRPVQRGEEGEEAGAIVEILGTVKINSYDRDRNVARAVITESLQPIERGHRVSDIERTFTVTPPQRNDRDLVATVLASLTPIENYAEQQIVYLDKGGDDGVRLGNRFFVVRRGDAYQRSRDEDDLREGLPYEVIAELRVVGLRRRSATTLVIRSTYEINSGDRAEMRRGY